MIMRCHNPNSTAYAHYGGRGISVCEEWREYLPFAEWAKSNGYHEGLTIDRIDANGDYCPENCRWATFKEQANNKTNNRYITYLGETKTMSQWSEIVGVDPGTIAFRLDNGWSVEKALTTTPQHTDITYRGKTMSAEAWGKEIGISPTTLRGRMLLGWSDDAIIETPPMFKQEVEYGGQEKQVSAWARAVGMNPQTLWSRLRKGTSLEIALTTPVQPTTHVLTTSDGESHTVTEWSKISNVDRHTIRNRLKRGWTIDEAVRTPGRKSKDGESDE